MIIRKRVFLTIALLFLTAFYTLDKIGDNFAGTPEEMETHLSLGAKALIEKAFADIKPEYLHDHHVHIVGLDEEQGTEVNPTMLSWWRILDYEKHQFI